MYPIAELETVVRETWWSRLRKRIRDWFSTTSRQHTALELSLLRRIDGLEDRLDAKDADIRELVQRHLDAMDAKDAELRRAKVETDCLKCEHLVDERNIQNLTSALELSHKALEAYTAMHIRTVVIGQELTKQLHGG